MLRLILGSFRLDLGTSFNRCFVWFCFQFGWVWVQVLIDASFDFVFILGGFGFRNYSIWAPCWVHCGTIWGLWRGPVEEKLPSRTEGRWRTLGSPHFKRFWPQKGATRRPKSIKNRWKIDARIDQKNNALQHRFLKPTWPQVGFQKRTNIYNKSMPTSIKKLKHRGIDVWKDFNGFLEETWRDVGTQID